MLLLTDPKFEEVMGQFRSARRTTGAVPKLDPWMVMDVPPVVGASTEITELTVGGSKEKKTELLKTDDDNTLTSRFRDSPAGELKRHTTCVEL